MAYKFNTSKKRSKIMRKIKSKNTKPEIKFRKKLWAKGIRYRINDKRYPGKPDIVIPKHKIAIFIDGEFWHGYNWKEKREKIKSHRDYWIPKIEKNIKRDKKYTKELKTMGWTVVRFWENEIKKGIDSCINKTMEIINGKL